MISVHCSGQTPTILYKHFQQSIVPDFSGIPSTQALLQPSKQHFLSSGHSESISHWFGSFLQELLSLKIKGHLLGVNLGRSGAPKNEQK